MTKANLIDKIDELLPQTQCGLCGHGGCRPYAEAIVYHNEKINRCPPGGIKTLTALADLLQLDTDSFQNEIINTKLPSVVSIREEDCIGCTKCIQVCPVDAIIGSSKKMHTVLTDECTGCELCLKPCPVDCIDILEISPLDELSQKQKSNQWRLRYQKRQVRLEQLSHLTKLEQPNFKEQTTASRKAAILQAIERAKSKD